MSKLKIIWICHFTNNEIQSKLPLWKKSNEFAPWISNKIKGFESRDEIELHVIAPHTHLKRQISFTQNNIHYYFLPYGIPFINHYWPKFFPFDLYSNYSAFRRKVKKIVTEINPSLLNLIGAENSYYSSSILDFKNDYPVLISIQGFISQMSKSIVLTTIQQKRIEIEEQILKEFKYYNGEPDSSTYISCFNPSHTFFKTYSAINEDIAYSIVDQIKKYDCLYYGRLDKNKGAEEFVKVISELKKQNPEIKGCITGQGDQEPFIDKARELNCLENIEFAGFLPTQKELFQKVKSSKVILVPTLFDRLPMTIREAMYLKVSIVAYATGGIPYVNEFDENILLVETGDYKGMAEKTIYLLQHKTERTTLAEKAYKYAQGEFNLKVNTERLIAAYKQILIETKNDEL